MAIHGHWYAYQALFNRLNGINGAAGGYWTTLQGRLHTQLIAPDDEGAPPRPFGCLMVLGEVTPPLQDSNVFKSVIRPELVVYFDESEQTGIISSSIESALKFVDDLYRCVMPDGSAPLQWNLGSRYIAVAGISKVTVKHGLRDGFDWAEVSATFEIEIRFSRADLGPSAT